MKDPTQKPDLYEDITGVMLLKAYKSVADFVNYHKDRVSPDIFTKKIHEIQDSFRSYCIDNVLKYDIYTDRIEPIVQIDFMRDGMAFGTKPGQYGYKEYFDDESHDLYKDIGNGFTDTSRDVLVEMIRSGDKDAIQTGYYLVYKGFIGGILMHWVMDAALNLLPEIYKFNSHLTLSYTTNYWFDEIVNRPCSFLNTDTFTLIQPSEAKEMSKDRYIIINIKPMIYAYPNGIVHMGKADLKTLGRGGK